MTRTHHRACPMVTTRTTPSSAQRISTITSNSRKAGLMFEAGR